MFAMVQVFRCGVLIVLLLVAVSSSIRKNNDSLGQISYLYFLCLYSCMIYTGILYTTTQSICLRLPFLFVFVRSDFFDLIVKRTTVQNKEEISSHMLELVLVAVLGHALAELNFAQLLFLLKIVQVHSSVHKLKDFRIFDARLFVALVQAIRRVTVAQVIV